MGYSAIGPEWNGTRLTDIQRRLEANDQAQSALRVRTGIVPVEKWDEYHRLLDERKSIKRELSELMDELNSHDRP